MRDDDDDDLGGATAIESLDSLRAAHDAAVAQGRAQPVAPARPQTPPSPPRQTPARAMPAPVAPAAPTRATPRAIQAPAPAPAPAPEPAPASAVPARPSSAQIATPSRGIVRPSRAMRTPPRPMQTVDPDEDAAAQAQAIDGFDADAWNSEPPTEHAVYPNGGFTPPAPAQPPVMASRGTGRMSTPPPGSLAMPGRTTSPGMAAQPAPFAPQPHMHPGHPGQPGPSAQYQTPVPMRPSMGHLATPVPGSMTAGMNAQQAPLDPVAQNKLASLASLSLDKGASPASRPQSGGGSKAPWILLALVVAGFGVYQFKSKGSSGKVVDSSGSGSGATTTPAPTSRVALLASGYVEAKTPIVLSAPTSGRLNELLVDNGVTIKKNQVVAVLDDKAIRAELNLQNARVRDANRQLANIQRLVRAQAATPVELDKARGAVEVAAAEIGPIKQRLDETRIKSPIDATVLEVLVRPGEAVTANAGVLRIADLRALVAEVNVSESDTSKVFIGQICEIVTEANRDVTFKGTVRELSEQVDKARGTRLVKVDIQNLEGEGGLKPGMSVQVKFKPPRSPDDPPEEPTTPTSPATGSAGSAAGSGSTASADGSAASGGSAGSDVAAGSDSAGAATASETTAAAAKATTSSAPASAKSTKRAPVRRKQTTTTTTAGPKGLGDL